MTLHDLAPIIHARRTALGLSQDRLAKLCGLSRATVNQLENGTLVDLGAAKLLALLALLGLELNAHRKPAPLDALALLSQTASVSYKRVLQPAELARALAQGDLRDGLGQVALRVLQPAELARALAQGDLPEAITPHIATVLDEAPLALILAAVEQAARATRTPPKTLWKHLVQWAHALQSPTTAWA